MALCSRHESSTVLSPALGVTMYRYAGGIKRHGLRKAVDKEVADSMKFIRPRSRLRLLTLLVTASLLWTLSIQNAAASFGSWVAIPSKVGSTITGLKGSIRNGPQDILLGSNDVLGYRLVLQFDVPSGGFGLIQVGFLRTSGSLNFGYDCGVTRATMNYEEYKTASAPSRYVCQLLTSRVPTSVQILRWEGPNPKIPAGDATAHM